MTTISDGAAALADTLGQGGVKATTDPGEAATNRPCLLVLPPVLDYSQGTHTAPVVTWRIAALAKQDRANLAALTELADLIDAATSVLRHIERAEPTTYALAPDKRVPAYVLTITA